MGRKNHLNWPLTKGAELTKLLNSSPNEAQPTGTETTPPRLTEHEWRYETRKYCMRKKELVIDA